MGKIITFYSFKGGVGRSMAMANVGVLLANAGFKTLLIDWDLEAPGLETYFQTYVDIKALRKKRGIIDLLYNRLENTSLNINIIKDLTKDIKNIDWTEYLTEIPFKHVKQKLYMMNAGMQDEFYIEKVRRFNYGEFYSKFAGGDYIEGFRNYCSSEYDFTLTDSRTGLTDSSGICSIQMPDILVVLFTPTQQGFEGSMMVAQMALAGQDELFFDRMKMKVFPVPTRLDDFQDKQYREWMIKIADGIENVVKAWLPSKELVNRRSLIEQIKIPYKSAYSYGEKLAVLDQGTTDPQGLGYSYLLITAVLANFLEGLAEFMEFEKRGLYIAKALKKENRSNAGVEIDINKESEIENKEKEKEISNKKEIHQKRKLRTLYATFSTIIILTIAVFIIFKQKFANAIVSNAPQDSLRQADNYKDFVLAYKNVQGLFDADSTAAVYKKYYTLSPAYKDSASTIKLEMDLIIKSSYNGINSRIDSMYKSINNKTFDVIYYFGDTIQRFGTLQNIPKEVLQKRYDSLFDVVNINNHKVDSMVSEFVTDSSGFYVTYLEEANVSVDQLMQYDEKGKTDSITVQLNPYLKIISIKTKAVKEGRLVSKNIYADKYKKKLVVQVFLCSPLNENNLKTQQMIVKALNKVADYDVYTQNFARPTDENSPYYSVENEIRYNSNELKLASDLKAMIENISKVQFKLVTSRRGTSSLSIFICDEPLKK